MEQHPVPQNVTGFQFKLIGDMTIRQFLYLGGGVFAGFLLYGLDAPSIIRWFLAITAGGVGFALAFLPIEDRPLDTWIVSFLKSIYLPTQFLWKKTGAIPAIFTRQFPDQTTRVSAAETLWREGKATAVEEYLTTLPVTASAAAVDKQENDFLHQVAASFGERPLTSTPALPSAPIINIAVEPVTPPPANQPVDRQSQELADKITGLQEELNGQTVDKDRFIEIQAQLAILRKERERLMRQVVELHKKLSQKPREETVKPNIVSPDGTSAMGMPNAPTLPNIPSGIIKTQKGQIIPGIIIEIRNQEGTPVRALKSGKLGQFTVSTPLPNGTYTIHLEDPQGTYNFDIIEINLNGEIMPSLEIFAKTPKDKITEEIRKKLFNRHF